MLCDLEAVDAGTGRTVKFFQRLQHHLKLDSSRRYRRDQMSWLRHKHGMEKQHEKIYIVFDQKCGSARGYLHDSLSSHLLLCTEIILVYFCQRCVFAALEASYFARASMMGWNHAVEVQGICSLQVNRVS